MIILILILIIIVLIITLIYCAYFAHDPMHKDEKVKILRFLAKKIDINVASAKKVLLSDQTQLCTTHSSYMAVLYLSTALTYLDVLHNIATNNEITLATGINYPWLFSYVDMLYYGSLELMADPSKKENNN